MSENRFLAKANEGENSPGTWIGSIVLVWISFLILGAIPLMLVIGIVQSKDPEAASRFMQDSGNFSLLGIDFNLQFLLILSPFLIGLVALFLSATRLHRRPFLSFITGFEKFRWNRFAAGAGVWTLLMVGYFAFQYLLDPGMFRLNFDAGRFFSFLPLALLLVPLQSAFEEIAIRGHIMQGLSRLSGGSVWGPLLITAFLFGMLHGLNPEIGNYGWVIMMAHYITFGLILGGFALLDEGLEVSIGLHTANNLFAFLVISYPGAVFESPSMVQQATMDPVMEYIAVLVLSGLAFLILFRKKLANTQT